MYVIRELIDFQPDKKQTNIAQALKYLTNAIKKRCTAFLISDFIDKDGFKEALTIANRKHDVVAIQVYDRRDASMPDVGLVRMADLETGSTRWVNTSSKKVRKAYDRWWYERQQLMSSRLKHSKVDFASVATDEDYVKALMGLFKQRGRR